MLNKGIIKELYGQGWGHTEIASVVGVSRQRIFQIIKGYKNTGKQGRLKKYRNFGECRNCGDTSTVLHHKDFNNLNDKPDNLIPLCTKCHIKEHKGRKKNYQRIEESATERIMVNLTPTQYKFLKVVAKARFDYRISAALRDIVQKALEGK